MLCECGNEALFQLKNGSWCCRQSKNSCPIKIQNQKLKMTGKKLRIVVKKIPWNKGKKGVYSKETLRIMSIKKLGKIPWNKGRKGVFSKETLEKMSKIKLNHICSDNTKIAVSESSKKRFSELEERKKQSIKLIEYLNKHPEIKEKRKQEMLNGKSKYLNSLPRQGFKNNKEWMLNGGASYCNKFIKNPSKPEIDLRNIVLELYPMAKPQHQIFNYSLDIALIEHKIAIEYDGYFHFDIEEHKEYHKERQEKIEKEGWKFLKYTIFDKFPTIEKIKEDILKLII